MELLKFEHSVVVMHGVFWCEGDFVVRGVSSCLVLLCGFIWLVFGILGKYLDVLWFIRNHRVRGKRYENLIEFCRCTFKFFPTTVILIKMDVVI